MTRYTSSTPALQMHYQLPTLDRLLNSFDVELPFYRNALTPSLARHLVNPQQEVDLLSSNLSSGALPLSYHLLKIYDFTFIK